MARGCAGLRSGPLWPVAHDAQSVLPPVAQVSAGWLRTPVTCCGRACGRGSATRGAGTSGCGPVHRLRLSFLAASQRRRGNAGRGPSAAGAWTRAVGEAQAVIGPASTILCRGEWWSPGDRAVVGRPSGAAGSSCSTWATARLLASRTGWRTRPGVRTACGCASRSTRPSSRAMASLRRVGWMRTLGAVTVCVCPVVAIRYCAPPQPFPVPRCPHLLSPRRPSRTGRPAGTPNCSAGHQAGPARTAVTRLRTGPVLPPYTPPTSPPVSVRAHQVSGRMSAAHQAFSGWPRCPASPSAHPRTLLQEEEEEEEKGKGRAGRAGVVGVLRGSGRRRLPLRVGAASALERRAGPARNRDRRVARRPVRDGSCTQPSALTAAALRPAIAERVVQRPACRAGGCAGPRLAPVPGGQGS